MFMQIWMIYCANGVQMITFVQSYFYISTMKDQTKELAKVTLYLDARRKKDNGLFPVKIRVYDTTIRKAKLYTTDFELTEKDFNRIVFPEKGQRFSKDEKAIKENLDSLMYLYMDKVKGLNVFTFDALENTLTIKTGDLINIFYQFETYTADLKNRNRFGTASSYELCMKSLKAYLKDKTGKEPKKLLFQEVTVKFLNDFEDWMTNTKGKSLTTVGIYLRGLRVMFNLAIDQKIIDKEIYPFGVKKYEIPSSKNTKKAFDNSQLNSLFQAIPKNEAQEKAKDFWFFSFVCNGINYKDILYLKWKNIEANQIIFIREKTKRTKKSNSHPIQVPLTDYAIKIIDKYGNKDKDKNNYVFPILTNDMTEEEKDMKRKTFITFSNKYLKQLAIANGLSDAISTYWARHTFATTAVRKNASLEFVSEALGHSDMKTTKNYFAGFEDKTKKEILDDITDFMR